MTILSRRTKEAIKTGLAIVIVYWIAMEMGWDKPYWAGITVVTINIMSAGVTLVRGVARSLGTLVGAVAGVALICLFPQERWWAMAGLSLWVGFCTYMLKGKSQSYFWFLAAMTCVVIVGVSSPPDSATVFQTAILRTQETAMGAVVYLVVAVFVWPQNTVGAFDEASRKLSATQARLFRTYLDQMSGKGAAEDSRPLRLQEIQLLAQVGKLLSAAESDSYAVWEVRHQWRRFLDQSTALMEALERWRESFTELKSLDVTGLLPNLAEMGVELDRRFDRIEGMHCVLGLFEGVVTAAADGYARMAERPAATLLHLGPGLGNGLANLHNANKARTPIVNVVGDHAVHQHLGDAADGDHDDDAQDRRQRPCLQHEDRLQRGVVAQREAQLERAGSLRRCGDLDVGQRVEHRPGYGDRHHRPDRQGHVDTVNHRSLPARPSARR